jgi:hypothetical protein
VTPEEAGEEILRGPYATCTRCHAAVRIYDNEWGGAACQGCNGTGKWLRADYKQACIELGMEIPEPPRRLSAGQGLVASAGKTANFGTGYIQDVTVLNQVLSSQQVATLYAKGVKLAIQTQMVSEILRNRRFKKELMGEWQTAEGVDDDS